MSDIEQDPSSHHTSGSTIDRWFDTSPILSTGQKLIAYRAAGLTRLVSILIGIFATIMILQADVDPGTALSGSLILDVVLIFGLFSGETAARNFTLFRVIAGILIWPFLVASQLGVIIGIAAFVATLIDLWIMWLLLLSETTKRRVIQALIIQSVVAGIGIVFSIYAFQYLLATENPLELRCDAVAYDRDADVPSLFYPNLDLYKPGVTTKTVDEFAFSVDYSYRPKEENRRHVITITVTSADTGQLFNSQIINSLTTRVVQNMKDTLPRGIGYSATGWVIVQHPDTHRNLRYICIPYPYRPGSFDDGTPFGAIFKQFYEDRRR